MSSASVEPAPTNKTLPTVLPVMPPPIDKDAELVTQEVFVPSVPSTFPELVVCEGRKALRALLAVVCPVPPFAIGRVPVTPVVRGNPVAFVSVPLDGVPRAGVTSVGLVARTKAPDPVGAVTPERYPNSVKVVALAASWLEAFVVSAREAVKGVVIVPENVGDAVGAFAFNCVCMELVTPDKYPASVEVTELTANSLDAPVTRSLLAVRGVVMVPLNVGESVGAFAFNCV